MADTKEHAYELIDRLPPTQLSAVVGLLEAMLERALLTTIAASAQVGISVSKSFMRFDFARRVKIETLLPVIFCWYLVFRSLVSQGRPIDLPQALGARRSFSNHIPPFVPFGTRGPWPLESLSVRLEGIHR